MESENSACFRPDGLTEIVPRVWMNDTLTQAWFDPVFGNVSHAEFHAELGWWIVYRAFEHVPKAVPSFHGAAWTKSEQQILGESTRLIRECLGPDDEVSLFLYQKRLPVLPMLYNVCVKPNDRAAPRFFYGLYNQTKQRILLSRSLVVDGVVDFSYYLVEEVFHATDPILAQPMSDAEHQGLMHEAEKRARAKQLLFLQKLSKKREISAHARKRTEWLITKIMRERQTGIR